MAKNFVLSVVIVLSACAPASTETKPPDIKYNRDVCDSCGMIISDPKFAAATLMTNGETRKFDDIGDMVAYHAQHSELQVKAWFVHDYPTQAWIRAEDAFFVVSREKLITPMGRGVAAFSAQSAAEAFSKNLGVKILTFEELKKEIK